MFSTYGCSCKNFPVNRFYQNFTAVRVTCIRNAKKWKVTDLVLEKKHVENYPDFEKLAHVIQHGLQGFTVQNIKGETTEANNLGHILWK